MAVSAHQGGQDGLQYEWETEYSPTPRVEVDTPRSDHCRWPWEVVGTSTSANTLTYLHTVKNHRSALAVYSPLPLTTAAYRNLSICKRSLGADDITNRNTLHTLYCLQETYSIYYWWTIASTHPFPHRHTYTCSRTPSYWKKCLWWTIAQTFQSPESRQPMSSISRDSFASVKMNSVYFVYGHNSISFGCVKASSKCTQNLDIVLQHPGANIPVLLLSWLKCWMKHIADCFQLNSW